jgi:hypothetical protein
LLNVRSKLLARFRLIARAISGLKMLGARPIPLAAESSLWQPVTVARIRPLQASRVDNV